MRIAFGTDHRGYKVRQVLVDLLQRMGHEIMDVGTFSEETIDYPDIAAQVARKVSNAEAERGILVGGTGIGMSMVANKVPGVRAAPCYDELSAELSRRHNDLNVLCLATDLLGEMVLDRLVEIWLRTPFDGGHHSRRVEKIGILEQTAVLGASGPASQ